MNYTINHRTSGAILFNLECRSLKICVEAAVKARANLADANLADANLADADLASADLAGAYLARADLAGADLADANLADANLAGANLAGADLADADLARANLADADLASAYLADADLARARVDLERVLAAAPAEAPGVLAALRAGRIDGSVYEGDCACLVGTIAKIRGCSYRDLDHDAASPIERLFRAILPGHVPAINPVAKIVEGWTEEWIAAHPAPAPTGPEAA